MTSALLNNGYGNWVAVRKEAKLTSWPLSDVAKACRVVVLQLLHVACLGTHEHSGWAKASGADGTGAGTLDIGTGGAGADADGILAASSSSSSSWLCSHEDLGYLDACLRKHAHSHKVCRLALAAALEEASGAPIQMPSQISSQIPEDASGALITTPSQIPSQIPEDALCAAAAVHAADHCHAILTATQGPASQTQCGLFPLPFVCHTSSGTKTAAATTTVMTADTEAATVEMAAESSTTTEAATEAAAMMTVDRLSIEHLLQMSAAAAGATAPTAADMVTSTAATVVVTTTTDLPSDLCTDPLSAYCSLVRQVMVKGQNPLPLHPMFASSGSGNGASAGAGASEAVRASSSSSSSSSSSTAVAVDRSNLLKQRTSARARYHTPSQRSYHTLVVVPGLLSYYTLVLHPLVFPFLSLFLHDINPSLPTPPSNTPC